MMHRALALAERGRGTTTPNPMVGAVVVRNSRVVGEGFHRRAGGPHAEITALRQAGGKAKGSKLYVTLEPCCHYGRTGPCTEAIRNAGIEEVVFAAKDPDPRVNGRGARELRRAGIAVRSGLLAKEAERLNEAYYHFHRVGRPFVTLKLAQSLDGRIATCTGDSQWITGPEARKFAHRLRAESTAVVVGAGTVIKDNPSLTVRHFKGPNPFRIVLSRSLEFSDDINLLRESRDQRTIFASSEANIERVSRQNRWSGVTYWSLRVGSDGQLDLHDFVAQAARFGLRSLLVEGGGALATSFVREGLVNKYVAIVAPMVIGDGISAMGDLRIRKLDQAIRLERFTTEPCGRDLVLTGYPVTARR